MKQHHFVISFDEATGAWSWNTDSEEAHFEDGTIYTEATNEWSSGYLGDGVYEPNEEILVDQLKRAVKIMNLVNGAGAQGEENE
jgi:hypothetical protein